MIVKIYYWIYFLRHPYPPFNIHYRYRFHAPHHDTYEVSWVSFTTEKLETYNWNYLDHYICTRGDTDFALVEAIKYWRFRVYLLPLNNSATKRIIEGAQHCDIYTSLNNFDYANLVEGFLKFIETVVNKIKRPNPKKPRVCLNTVKICKYFLFCFRTSSNCISIFFSELHDVFDSALKSYKNDYIKLLKFSFYLTVSNFFFFFS